MNQPPVQAGQPSAYELDAWNQLAAHHNRQTRRSRKKAARGRDSVAGDLQHANAHSPALLPSDLDRHRGAVVAEVGEGTAQMFASIARVGLGPRGMLRKYRRRGHEVTRLMDLRSLDLEVVEHVRWRHLGLAYSVYSGLAGAGAALLATGGEFGLVSGVGAGLGALVLLGVAAADIASTLTLTHRATAHVALSYGYDPTDPTEKAFAATIPRLAFAGTQVAKQVALADTVKLSALLGRGATWRVLEGTLAGSIARSVAKMTGVKLTKGALAKLVPFAGMLIGGVMNFVTLEHTVDAAIVAYRARFLIEKYPHLVDQLEQAPVLSEPQPLDAHAPSHRAVEA